MPGFEITGMGRERRRAIVWAVVGTACLLGARTPVWAVGISLLLGGLAGTVSIVLATRHLSPMQGRLAAIGPTVASIAGLIGIVSLIDGGQGALGWVGLGAILTATESAASVLVGARIVDRLNRRHAGFLAQLEQAAAVRRQLVPPTPAPAPADAREVFLEALPDDLRMEAERFFQPMMLATPFRSLDTLPPAHSSLSGAPLLPPGSPWPTRGDRALDFLCQIRLDDVPPTHHARPASGLLSFFCDTYDTPWGSDEADKGGFAVLFHPDVRGLQTCLMPGTGPHPPLRKPLRFVAIPTFTPPRSLEERIREFIEVADPDTAATIEESFEALLESSYTDGHRVLSLPVLVQNDMDDDLRVGARAHGLPEDTEWTLLLQLDSDRDLKWSWGDAGCLYFWVPIADLSVGRFDRCWMVLQCS